LQSTLKPPAPAAFFLSAAWLPAELPSIKLPMVQRNFRASARGREEVATVETCHCASRGVGTFRSLKAEVMAASVFAPSFLMAAVRRKGVEYFFEN